MKKLNKYKKSIFKKTWVKYHFIYKITNTKTGHYYIGAHSTNNVNDGYMGSGKYLNKAMYLYGGSFFKREIIKWCKNPKDKWSWERKLVNKKVINDPKSYNLLLGGKRASILGDIRTKEWFGSI